MAQVDGTPAPAGGGAARRPAGTGPARPARGLFLAAALAALLPAPLLADAIEEARAAYLAVWETAPLSVRRNFFVTAPAEGFGLYEKRASNVFAENEPIHIYFEPVGYGWKPEGGWNVFGLTIGLRILTTEAQELFAKRDFLELATRSVDRPTEFFGNVALNLSGLPPGSYVLELVLQDVASDEVATMAMPIEIR